MLGNFLFFLYIYICQENARRLVALEFCEDTHRRLVLEK